MRDRSNINETLPDSGRGGFPIKPLFSRINGCLLAVFAQTLETQDAIDLGEQGVVSTDAHVGAGMNVGTTLANQNVTRQNELTVGALGAKALGLGITAVRGGAHTFFMGEELQTDVQHFKYILSIR